MRVKNFFIFADGGSRGNPGPAAVGFVIKDSEGKILVGKGKGIGRTTNNVAEYMAVVEALKWLVKNKKVGKWEVKSKPGSGTSIRFFLDSQLIINQLNGLYKIKNARLRNLIIKVRQLEKRVGGNVSYHFIPRGKNKEADFLVNQTLEKV